MTGTNEQSTEKIILIACLLGQENPFELEDRVAEIRRLLETLGVEVADTLVQRRPRLDPQSVVGKGKLDELVGLVEHHCVTGVVFDRLLTPAQVRHLEKVLNVKVLDRTGIILDIFASHARTREAAVAVELAQLRYMLPRLTGAWSHFSEQFGGVGTKGPGETQLETDKRLVRTRIHKLEQKLKEIEKSRAVRMKEPREWPLVAVVGYTNAGKSSLLRALCSQDVHAKDELFSTLDTLKRRVALSQNRWAVLTDTVGFIEQLPTELVPSFKSTLTAASGADLILHVVDASDPRSQRRQEVTEEILKEVGVDPSLIVLVHNKADLLEELPAKWMWKENQEVFVSAAEGLGMEDLKTLLTRRLFGQRGRYVITLGPAEAGHLGSLQKLGTMLDIQGTQEGGYRLLMEEKVGQKVAHFLAQKGLTVEEDGGELGETLGKEGIPADNLNKAKKRRAPKHPSQSCV